MENIDIAKIFDEIADILELKGENPFRIRSYRRGARVIRDMPEDAKSLLETGDLQKVQGIGASLAEKIDEIVRTGTCKFYEEIKKDPVYSLAELLSIPGVGPKLAVRLNKELGVKTVDDLQTAAERGDLHSLEGIREKLEDKILRGIEQYRRHIGRFRLAEALTHAEGIVKTLEKIRGVSKIDIAGSLRRRRDTIGDIDILVIARSSKKIMDAFTSMDNVADVLAKGDTKSSVLLKSGIQVDLRILTAADYGAALYYFTGSKDHNVAMRDRAKRMGRKISEYGIFEVETDKRLGGKTEREIFREVGLPFIPPELRENSGEIEAAEKGKLPKLIEPTDIRGDLHVHTSGSDGVHTVGEMAVSARELGYKYIAITDHSQAVRIAGGLNDEELTAHIKTIRKVNKGTVGIEILTGIEVDVLADGSLDISDEVLAECDVVVAAVHSRFNMSRDEMTSRVIKGIKNKHVNILAHPTGRIINERDPYEIDMEQVIIVAAKSKVALELNAYPDRLDLKDTHCRQAKEAGVKIAIGTDSHARTQLTNMRYGVATARRGWLEPADVINTYSLTKLRKFLRK